MKSPLTLSTGIDCHAASNRLAEFARLAAPVARTTRHAIFAVGFAASCGLFGSGVAQAADLTLKLSNVVGSEGTVRIAVYANEADYRKKSVRAIKQAASGPRMTIVVKDLPEGEYAVTLFQDLDGNEKLDTNLLGIPKEPWGASLQGKSVIGAPGWNDARFKLPAGGLALDIGL